MSRSGSHSSYIYLSVRVQANGNSPGQHIISNSDLLKLKWVWKNLRPSWRRVPSDQRQFPPRLTSLSYPSASSWTTMYHTNVSLHHTDQFISKPGQTDPSGWGIMGVNQGWDMLVSVATKHILDLFWAGVTCWGFLDRFFLSFFFGFLRPNPITGRDQADGEHPIRHLGPKNLSRTRGPEPKER